MGSSFTEKAEKVLNDSVRIAEDLGHTYIGSEHALLALLSEKNSCAGIILAKSGVSAEGIRLCLKDYSGFGTKTHLNAKDTTPKFRSIIESSLKCAQKYSSLKIGTEHVLFAILDEGDCTAKKILEKAGFDIALLKEEVTSFLRTVEKSCAILRKSEKEPVIPNLLKYGKDLTADAKETDSDPVIGRERESDRLVRVLSRKTKNNPCLIGEAGVGKTAIVEGLAKRISNGDVPSPLIGKSIISLDLSAMVAGAKYRGDFEDRIKSILEETKKNDSVILFIDEIHTLVGAGAAEGAIDAANILKPALARGEIRLIGATTLSEYRKYIENDNALERRFQPIIVEEPSTNEAIEMLMGLKARYENYHGVRITDESVRAAVTLSKRYIRDRYLPDKAIDVLDEACVKASINSAKKSEARRDGEFCDEYPGVDFAFFKSNDGKNERYMPVITEQNIRDAVSEMTGVPITNDGNRFSDLSARLEKHVLGQTDAVSALSDAVLRSSAGINNENRPRGVFLFVGESGVGKTELARALAFELFGSYDSLLRYDMSEFSEKHSISKFIGSPPGYVGFNETTPICEVVRKHPYSVMLFDEIEKASPEVLNLFLQIADTGRLTDSGGRSADFRNSYIIMTSNASTTEGGEGLGFISKNKEISDEKLLVSFSKELLLRFDEVIHFKKQSIEVLEEIVKKQLKELAEKVYERGVTVTFGEEIYDYIARKCKKDGARSIGRFLSSEIQTPIAKEILKNDNEPIEVTFEIKNDKLTFKVGKKETAKK